MAAAFSPVGTSWTGGCGRSRRCGGRRDAPDPPAESCRGSGDRLRSAAEGRKPAVAVRPLTAAPALHGNQANTCGHAKAQANQDLFLSRRHLRSRLLSPLSSRATDLWVQALDYRQRLQKTVLSRRDCVRRSSIQSNRRNRTAFQVLGTRRTGRIKFGVPIGNRTRVSALKGPRPDLWTMGTCCGANSGHGRSFRRGQSLHILPDWTGTTNARVVCRCPSLTVRATSCTRSDRRCPARSASRRPASSAPTSSSAASRA